MVQLNRQFLDMSYLVDALKVVFCFKKVAKKLQFHDISRILPCGNSLHGAMTGNVMQNFVQLRFPTPFFKKMDFKRVRRV